MTTEYILDCSYGKDSLACLEAIKILGLPLTRIIHAEVWATPTIPADLPPMVEFKKKADKIIKERYGITVEHITAMKSCGGGKNSFERQFYSTRKNKVFGRTLYGFPCTLHPWCNSKLKVEALSETNLRRYILSRNKISFGSQRFTASRCFGDNGATRISKCQQSTDYRLCDKMESILHGRTQKKTLFTKPERYGRYKYSALFGNCR